LILLPNSPQAGSDMLNNMVASFSASNMVGESMKKASRKSKAKTETIIPIEDEEEEDTSETEE
jgi:hypothetical protein